MIGVETHHCKNGLLPLPVASSEYDEIGDNPEFLPALPRPPAGPPASEALEQPTRLQILKGESPFFRQLPVSDG